MDKEREKVIEKAEGGDVVWEQDTVEAQSKTTLEDDKGKGNQVVLRFFQYTSNPEAFKDRLPSAQQLFNAHAKEMEIKLWQDGLVPEPQIEPRLLFSKDKSHYKFVIGCRLGRGNILNEKPLTLSEIAHDSRRDTN